MSYVRVAAYLTDTDSLRVYSTIRAAMFVTDCSVSAYRFRLGGIPHVALIGLDEPTGNLSAIIDELLSQGEPATLPDSILGKLAVRRVNAQELGPWVEMHHRP